ncbi:hypothetical protein C1H87_10350 [Flavivirga eckloniae]|uniref:Uncharacterized protein n=1 Tax=Flavivirga eckloniae TaxID=1803846 RepID=A0A2K9PQH5_9FLAO|nr:hypothetical protein C1H87_10350 [Flavivirga eckloniae]
MLDFIENLFSIILKIFIFVALFTIYVLISMWVIVYFSINDHLSEDNMGLLAIFLSVVLTTVTIHFAKSFFKKMQNQK